MRQRIEAIKKNNYPYWFSSAALPARRLWRIPVDAQTVPRVNRPEEKMTRSSWLNCALRDDEAVYWVSIGH